MMIYTDVTPYLAFGINLPERATERFLRNEEGYSISYKITYLNTDGFFIDTWCSSYWLFPIL